MIFAALGRSWATLAGAVFVLAVTALGQDRSANPTPETSGRWHVGGWVTYWDFDRGVASVTDPRSPLEDVYFFAVHLDSNARPRWASSEIDFPRAVRELRFQGFDVWMTVVNDIESVNRQSRRLKDPAVVHRILADRALRKEHRQHLVRMALEGGFSGIDIDYENLYVQDRDSFTSFIGELAEELRTVGLGLSVTVQPKVKDSSSRGPGAMDWERLCKHVDRLQIMLYNLHNQKTPPGPMATPAWVKEVAGYARQQCDAKRVVPVLKVSGMCWSKGDTVEVRGIHYEEAVELLSLHGAELERHVEGSVPFFTYTRDRTEYTVYYEDAESLMEKLVVMEPLGFDRVVFWSLGRQDPELFERFRETKR